MKKILLCVCVVFCSVLLSLDVCATESTENDSSNSAQSGWVSEGSVHANVIRLIDDGSYYDAFEFELTYQSDDGYLFFVYDSSQKYYSNQYMIYNTSRSFFKTGVCNSFVDGKIDYISDQGTNKVLTNSYNLKRTDLNSPKFNGDVAFDYITFVGSPNYSFDIETDIPIFDVNDMDSINAYIETGDTSGAMNSDKKTVSDEIEKPHNLKITGRFLWNRFANSFDVFTNTLTGSSFNAKNRLLSLAWSNPVDLTYTYDVQLSCVVNTDSGQASSDWYSVFENVSYGGDATIVDMVNSVTGVNHLDTYLKDYVCSVSGFDDVAMIKLRVRNCSGNLCSNWVEISLDSSGNGYATVTDQQGNVVEDDEYTSSDGYDTNGSDGSSVADDAASSTVENIDYGDINVDGILKYIQGGFGLLGNNGIIAMMSKTFTFLPASIWTIIKFYVSMLVIIALIRAVKDVLFG